MRGGVGGPACQSGRQVGEVVLKVSRTGVDEEVSRMRREVGWGEGARDFGGEPGLSRGKYMHDRMERGVGGAEPRVLRRGACGGGLGGNNHPSSSRRENSKREKMDQKKNPVRRWNFSVP